MSNRPSHLLFGYVRRQKTLACGLALVIVGGTVSAVATQYVLKLLIDAMTVRDGNAGSLYLRLALLLALLLAEGLSWRLGGYLGSRLVIRLGKDVRADLFARTMEQPWHFFLGHHSGALSSRIGAAGQAATASLSTMIWNVVPPAGDLVGSVIVLSAVEWHLAAGLLLAAALLSYYLHGRGAAGFAVHRDFHDTAAKVSGQVGDVLGGILLVKSFGSAAQELRRFSQLVANEATKHRRSWMFLERLRLTHDLSFWLVISCLLFVALHAWERHRISTGDVVVIMTLSLRIMNGSREIALAVLGFSQQLGGLREAMTVLSIRDDPIDSARRLSCTAPDIVLDHVSYTPGGLQPLLQDFSLRIPCGQTLGIVGPSGAGKSTILRLIQGLVKPDEGEVTIGGQSLADLAPGDVANVVSAVTQEVHLLHRTLRENLCYGRPDASPAELDDVMRITGCASFIDNLPEGLQTVAGERGITLSGGQRQRLALARALLKRAPILLLDEATAALDSSSEADLQRAIQTRASGRTIIAVAHRLSTVMSFDRVIVVEQGEIVEDGPPALLRVNQGPFAAMWRAQGEHPAHYQAID